MYKSDVYIFAALANLLHLVFKLFGIMLPFGKRAFGSRANEPKVGFFLHCVIGEQDLG